MKESLNEREEEFQRAYEDWKATGSKSSRDVMFTRIYDCCSNICKKRLMNKGLTAEEIQETSMDSAIYAFDIMLRKDYHPQKLSSYCWPYCTKMMLNPQKQFNDKIVLAEDYIVEKQQYED